MHAVTIVLNICCRRLTQYKCTWLYVTVASNKSNIYEYLSLSHLKPSPKDEVQMFY